MFLLCLYVTTNFLWLDIWFRIECTGNFVHSASLFQTVLEAVFDVHTVEVRSPSFQDASIYTLQSLCIVTKFGLDVFNGCIHRIDSYAFSAGESCNENPPYSSNDFKTYCDRFSNNVSTGLATFVRMLSAGFGILVIAFLIRILFLWIQTDFSHSTGPKTSIPFLYLFFINLNDVSKWFLHDRLHTML